MNPLNKPSRSHLSSLFGLTPKEVRWAIAILSTITGVFIGYWLYWAVH